MKALITGSLGFVGKYLRAELEQHGYEVVGLDIQPGDRTLQADLMDAEQIRRIVAEERPNAIFHLAAQADVGKSWKAPQLTMQLNIVASLNLMEAVRAVDPKGIRMVIVGSSDQYGNLGTAGANVTEDMELKPQTPYAISKRAPESHSFQFSDQLHKAVFIQVVLYGVSQGGPDLPIIKHLHDALLQPRRRRSAHGLHDPGLRFRHCEGREG